MTANANLPDKVIVRNETSQENMFVYLTYNESIAHVGNKIEKNKTRAFGKELGKQLNFLYVFSSWEVEDYDTANHEFINYMEKIDLNKIIETNPLPIEIELDNFYIEPIYNTDENSLIIILTDK